MFIHEKRHLQLGSHSVGSADQNRLADSRKIQPVQTAEASDVFAAAEDHGPGYMLFHQLDRFISCGDIYSGFFIAFAETFSHVISPLFR